MLVLVRGLIIVDHENIISICLDSNGNFLKRWIIGAVIGHVHLCHCALARSIVLLLDEGCLSNGGLNLLALHLEEVGGAPQQVRVI